MVACEDCRQEMKTAPSCTVDVLVIGGQRFDRNRQDRPPIGPHGRCGDCGIQRGGFHHLGCDIERCPRCHRQLLSCGCCDHPDDEDLELLIGVANGVVVHPTALRGLHLPPGRFPFQGT